MGLTFSRAKSNTTFSNTFPVDVLNNYTEVFNKILKADMPWHDLKTIFSVKIEDSVSQEFSPAADAEIEVTSIGAHEVVSEE